MNVKNKPLSNPKLPTHGATILLSYEEEGKRFFFFPNKKKKENEFVKIIIYM